MAMPGINEEDNAFVWNSNPKTDDPKKEIIRDFAS